MIYIFTFIFWYNKRYDCIGETSTSTTTGKETETSTTSHSTTSDGHNNGSNNENSHNNDASGSDSDSAYSILPSIFFALAACFVLFI